MTPSITINKQMIEMGHRILMTRKARSYRIFDFVVALIAAGFSWWQTGQGGQLILGSTDYSGISIWLTKLTAAMLVGAGTLAVLHYLRRWQAEKIVQSVVRQWENETGGYASVELHHDHLSCQISGKERTFKREQIKEVVRAEGCLILILNEPTLGKEVFLPFAHDPRIQAWIG